MQVDRFSEEDYCPQRCLLQGSELTLTNERIIYLRTATRPTAVLAR